MKTMTFALCFGNRGFMPGELILDARADMIKAVTAAGFRYLIMDETTTRYGAWKPVMKTACMPVG